MNEKNKKFKFPDLSNVINFIFNTIVVILIIVIVFFSLLCLLKKEANEEIEEIAKNSNNSSELITPYTFGSELIYDEYTKIIYIKTRTYGYCYIYLPYYSENGNLCRYVDGEIVEVSDSDE